MESLGENLQRLNTNESLTASSIFSRNDSSSSMATTFSPCLSKSLSFTKINDEPALRKSSLSTSQTSIGDALHLALSQIPANQGQPKSANKLTTTPTNEVAIDSKWCIILVGLPAVGKSSICKNLKSFVSEAFGESKDFKIDSFNAGNFRRKLSNFENQTSNYFDFTNKEAKVQREMFAHIALDHLLNSLINSQIDVGIFDATNSTKDRRDYIVNTIKDKETKTGIKINTLLLHVKCSSEEFWRYNIEGKTSGPDYINLDHDLAIEDFIKRIQQYRKAFEDITVEELQQHKGLVYMSIDNAGRDVDIETNGFETTDDFVHQAFDEFVRTYHERYGKIYESKVNHFWGKA